MHLSIYMNSTGAAAFSFDDDHLHLPGGRVVGLRRLRPGSWELVDEGEPDEVLPSLSDEQAQHLRSVVQAELLRDERQAQIAADRAAAKAAAQAAAEAAARSKRRREWSRLFATLTRTLAVMR
jgi:hypothetical protein